MLIWSLTFFFLSVPSTDPIIRKSFIGGVVFGYGGRSGPIGGVARA
jgi:hypothetical protein